MKDIQISILIPTYKRPDMLKRCLDKCLLAVDEALQDRFEVIVSDNSDMPENEKLLQDFGKEWKGETKYISDNTGRNMQENWNALAREAKGIYLQYVHDDDYLVKGAGQHLLDVTSKYLNDPITIRFSNELVRLDESIIRIDTLPDAELTKKEAVQNLVSQSSYVRFPCMVIPREHLAKTGLFSVEARIQDWTTWLALADLKGLIVSERVTCAYTIHEGAETNNMFNIDVLTELTGLLKKYSRPYASTEEESNSYVAQYVYKWIFAGVWRAIKKRNFKIASSRLALRDFAVSQELKCPAKYIPMQMVFSAILFPVPRAA